MPQPEEVDQGKTGQGYNLKKAIEPADVNQLGNQPKDEFGCCVRFRERGLFEVA